MTTRKIDAGWVEANQRYLAAEFALLKQRLAANSAEHPGEFAEAERVVEATVDTLHEPAAIDRLTGLFELSVFERATLLLCAGVEMDSELARLCGESQGHPNRLYATFGLALATLPEPQWSALTPFGPLRRFQLVQLEPGYGLTSVPLRIDEGILHHLAGETLLDARLSTLAQPIPVPDWIDAEQQTMALQIARDFEHRKPSVQILNLCGDDSSGQRDVAAVAASEAGRLLFVVDTEQLPPMGADLDQFITLWQREAILLPAALLIQCEPSGFTPSARHLTERLEGQVFVASREPLSIRRAFLRIEVNKPGPAAQKQLWQQSLGDAAANFNGTLDRVSEQFRLSTRMIFSTGSLIATREDTAGSDALWSACRSLARPKLEDLAKRIDPFAEWDDLVLPDAQKQMLRQLAVQVRYRMKVYETWGFSANGRRGLGVSALFTGESGTGKTLAAEVLAHELGLDLYRIDLSSVVSKYIGETEKNLKRVFDAAEEGGVLLLFDEADALFGKRSEVRDSHDRYANIEVGYLLQRMESYEGLAILTTNLKSSLDKAFQRRLRFVVNFPFPDASQREVIWSRVFPAKTPISGVDARKLAQLNITGGNIRNIALGAAFLAAESSESVGMSHLLQAARLEAQKIDRPISDAELRGWI